MNKKTIVYAAIALVLLVLILVGLQGGFHSKVPGGTTSTAPPERTVPKTFKVRKTKTSGQVTVSGTVSSRETARVAARLQGEVVEIRGDAGDRVRKGQVLVVIKSKELTERVSQAEAALDSAKADLAKTEADFQRFKALLAKESVAQQAFDESKARLEMAQATEQRARASLDEVKTLQSYTRVTAPFEGIIAQRNVNLGDLTVPGRAMLTIFMPGDLELVASVGEQYAEFLKVSTSAVVAVPAIKLQQKTSLREVVPQTHEKTRTITVKAPLSRADGLRPGLYGTLTFFTRSSEAILIPSRAVRTVGQLETVKVFHNGAIKVRHVKTGRKSNGKTEILSGLDPGDLVVLD